jgi:hypothetical protein
MQTRNDWAGFLVNYGGVVSQKNLRPHTAEIAKSMMAFNPDRSWQGGRRRAVAALVPRSRLAEAPCLCPLSRSD